jgi:phospholipid transport system substrate-binding protein
MKQLLVASLAVALSIPLATPARADSSPEAALAFVKNRRQELERVVRQPATVERDAQLNATLESTIDFAELSRRTLGEPCPATEQACENYWTKLSSQQQAEVTSLLTLLVEKNLARSCTRTFDYTVTYARATPFGRDARVHTAMRSRRDPREPSVEIDYIVHGSENGYRVVDIVTDGASITKDYYDQLRWLLRNPGPDFRALVGRLTEQIARRD